MASFEILAPRPSREPSNLFGRDVDALEYHAGVQFISDLSLEQLQAYAAQFEAQHREETAALQARNAAREQEHSATVEAYVAEVDDVIQTLQQVEWHSPFTTERIQQVTHLLKTTIATERAERPVKDTMPPSLGLAWGQVRTELQKRQAAAEKRRNMLRQDLALLGVEV